MWRREDPQGDETGKVQWDLVPYTRGLGLDIGCGPRKAFPHFIGVDNRKDTGLFNIPMNPDLTVPDACYLPLFASNSMDFIFSSHTLEHIEDHKKALREWWRLVKDGGHFCLYLPHKLFYPNIGSPDANPDHKHDFLPSDIIEAMKEIGGWDLLVNEDRNGGREYSFFQVYKKYSDKGMHRFSCNEPKPAKTCIVIRYGAWGDVIQMSSILPALKEEGYHITLYSVPRAWEAVKHEPLIDRVVLQDHEQVPNAWLGPFWDHLKTKCDRFINLSESVEATLLTMPDRMPAQWNKEARHAMMNHNYVEFTHQLAGVPYTKPLMRFVPTEEERAQAKKRAKEINGAPLILWVLSGSSVHKVWPHMDPVMRSILNTFPNAQVVTAGDERCKLLEGVWEKDERVIKTSGKWSIRETLTFAQECNLVIGPETGVMSSVAMLPMPKIVLLSHSSVENLTRDWVNTISLSSKETPCSPCHRMVYDWSQCNKHEPTGAAHCMAHIQPQEMWASILEALEVKLEQGAAHA